MATFYVDIGLSTGLGTKDGLTPNNCKGWDEFAHYDFTDGFLYLNASVGDVFLLRGSKALDDYTPDVFIRAWTFGGSNTTASLKPWDLNAYGPWRMSLTSGMPLSATTIHFENIIECEGAIIDCSQIIGNNDVIFNTVNLASGATVTIKNCFIRGLGDMPGPAGVGFDLNGSDSVIYVIKGCTIVCNALSVLASDNNPTASFTDCIIDGYIATAVEGLITGSFTTNRCAFTTGSDPNTLYGTHTLYQYNWTAPLWPAWDASKTSFNMNVLTYGITAPPQPGNEPYTGYQTDMFGDRRTGIGAGFMPGTQKIRTLQILNGAVTRELLAPDVAGTGFHLDSTGLNIIARPSSGFVVDFTGISVDFLKETPTGLIDGTNDSYLLSFVPVSGSDQIFLNGLFQEAGGNDYALSNKTLTFTNVPKIGDIIRAVYLVASRI
jgi:hypothetical protein